MQGDSTYPRSLLPYRSPQRLRALAERTMLTLFIGEQVDRKELYESELFFEPHLDAHTSREAEEKMAEHTALEVEKLDQETVNCLRSTLPGITKLRIDIGGNRDLLEQIIGGIIQLLEHWPNKLETLGIWADFPYLRQFSGNGEYKDLLRTLFAVINEKLTSLKYLTMAIPSFYGEQDLNVPFISRLKLFSTSLPIEQLQFSPNPNGALQENLTEVRFFEWSTLTNENKAKLLEMSDRLACQITALNLKYEEDEQFASFIAHFPALKWYRQCGDLAVAEIPHFLNSLSVLSQLKYLEMRVHSPEYDTVTYTGTTSQLAFQPLPSLETLSILGTIRNHRFISFFGPFSRRFPSLKWLKVRVNVRFGIQRGTEPDPKETVTGYMLQFAQQQLKGSFQLTFFISPRFYTYKEEFNFTEGRKFEGWPYEEENLIDD